MMTNKLYLIFIFFITLSTSAQNKKLFKIDTLSILENKNLDHFLKKFETENFIVCKSKTEIPKHILKSLKRINGEFSLSELDAEFQDSDIVEANKKLPSRGLKFLAKSENTLVIYYGLSSGPGISSKFLFIDFDEKGINDIWIGNGIGIGNYNSITDIIKHINFYRDKYLGLQSNFLSF